MERGEEATGAPGRWLSVLRAWSGQHPDRPAQMLRREPAILRFIGPLALLVLAATVVCAVVGLVLAVQADDYLETEHRQALRGAIEALHAVAPDVSRVEPGLIHILERASGLKDLKFDPDPPSGEREVQSLLDRNGRIVGWFSWEGERPATAIMLRLLPFGALIALGLLLFAGLAMWQLNRLGSMLGRSERQLHRLTHEDSVTGLFNQLHLLELLDERLAARRGDDVVAFALLDFGGLDDMKEAIGAAEENGVLIEIAHRLRDAMPEGAAVGRLRGDKFGLVIPAGSAAAAVAIAETARDVGSRAFWMGQVVQMSANVGVTVAPRDSGRCSELKERADLALRAARQRGRGLVVEFTADMAADFDERRFIKSELSARSQPAPSTSTTSRS